MPRWAAATADGRRGQLAPRLAGMHTGGQSPGTSGRRRAEPGTGRHRTRWHSAPIAARTPCPAPVPGAAELSLRQSREPRQCHEWAKRLPAPRGRAEAPLVPHKGQTGPGGRADAPLVPHEGGKGQAPKGRAVAQPVPHKGQQKGQAPSGRAAAPLVPHEGRKGASPERTSCRSAGAAQRAAKGASPERASCRSAERQNKPHERSRARRVRHAPAHQRQYGRMQCGRGGACNPRPRGPSTPCRRIAVSEVA